MSASRFSLGLLTVRGSTIANNTSTAAFVGGNHATGLFHDRWVVRLPEVEAARARADGAEAFEPVAGRPMKGYVLVPVGDVDDDRKIAAWVERGLATAAAMPAKR